MNVRQSSNNRKTTIRLDNGVKITIDATETVSRKLKQLKEQALQKQESYVNINHH